MSCRSCGEPIGVIRKVFFASQCAACAAEAEAVRAGARSAHERLLEEVAAGTVDSQTAAERADALAEAACLSERNLRQLNDRAFSQLAETALADDQLTTAEEAYLLDVASALKIDQAAIEARHPTLMERLVVARVNDGRLPIVEAPSVMPDGGEVVHAETNAAVLENVTTKEQVGGRG